MSTMQIRKYDFILNRIMGHVPMPPFDRVTAHVFIFCPKTGNFLAVKNAQKGTQPLKWGIPGGKGEAGERPHETAAREVFEEIGFQVNGLIPLYYEHKKGSNKSEPGTWNFIFGTNVPAEFCPKLNESELIDSQWSKLHSWPYPTHAALERAYQKDGKAFIQEMMTGRLPIPVPHNRITVIVADSSGRFLAVKKGGAWETPINDVMPGELLYEGAKNLVRFHTGRKGAKYLHFNSNISKIENVILHDHFLMACLPACLPANGDLNTENNFDIQWLEPLKWIELLYEGETTPDLAQMHILIDLYNTRDKNPEFITPEP